MPITKTTHRMNKNNTTQIYAKEIGLLGDGATNDATKLNTWITSIGSTKADLILTSGTYLISTNVTFPSNVNVVSKHGGMFKVSNTFSITGTNTKLECGLWQCFDLSLGGTIAGTWNIKEVYPQWFGAIGDGSSDDSIPIQKSIDMASLDGGSVYFLSGVYLVTVALTLKENVSIIGSSCANIAPSLWKVKILHTPTVANTNLFETDTPTSSHISGISIKNICIEGGSNSQYAFVLTNIGKLKMDNVYIYKNFVEGLRISGAINCTFDKTIILLNNFNTNSTCVRFNTSISTTVTFNDCYFTSAYRPIIVEQAMLLNGVFNETIFESCTKGLSIYPGNVLTFNSSYSEDIPRSAIGGAESIFEFGISGVAESGYAQGICQINGGTYTGTNGTIDANSKIINVGRWASLSVIGARFTNAGYSIAITSDTKAVSFINIHEQAISNSITVTNGITYYMINTAGSLAPRLSANVLETKSSGGKRWTLNSAFAQTNSDFYIANASKSGGATIPFAIDAQDNIHINGLIAPGTSEYLTIHSPKTTVIGAIGDVSATYCETEDTKAVLKARKGNGENGQILISSNGTTATRPTTGRAIGVQFFDTTIGKPIWWQGIKWVLSDGTDAP